MTNPLLTEDNMEDLKTKLPILLDQYVALRDELALANKKHKQLEEDLKQKMMGIKQNLLEVCNTTGVDSIKVGERLFYRTVKSTYWTSDWASMNQFIVDNACPDLLTKSIHQSNMKAFLEENPDKLPVGLNVKTEYSVTVK